MEFSLHGILQTLCTTFVPYVQPFDTNPHGVTSDPSMTAWSGAQLNRTLVHLRLS